MVGTGKGDSDVMEFSKMRMMVGTKTLKAKQ
jgi:hypothetical protein